MQKIDIHVHMWDYGWLPEPHKMNMAMAAARRRNPPADPMTIRPRVGNGFMDPTGAMNVQHIDRMGFDRAVVQVVDWSLGYGVEADNTIDEINEGTAAACRNHPDRLHWFCGVDPRRPGAAQKVERWITEFGAKGFKLYPPMGYYPFEDECVEIYKVLMKHDVPVLAHTQAGQKNSEPIHWMEVCAKYRDLKVILGHAGTEGPFWSRYGWEQAVIVAGRNHNVYLDPTEWQLWGALKPRNVSDLVERMGIMREVVGAERIVFGSDNPLGRNGTDGSNDTELLFIYNNLNIIGKWYGHPFTKDEVDLFLGGNAARLLKLG